MAESHIDRRYMRPDGTQGGFPKSVYKFMEKRFADDLIRHGAFQIGTLYGFRNAEKHRDGILDVGEGTSVHTEKASSDGKLKLSVYSTHMVQGDLSGISITDMTITRNLNEFDFYIYCLSLSDSWSNDISAEYDTCVEISDALKFAVYMRRVLWNNQLCTAEMECGNVDYKDRHSATITIDDQHTGGPTTRPAFIKPAEYKLQGEFRFLFEPRRRPITATVLTDPFMGTFCKEHSRRAPC